MKTLYLLLAALCALSACSSKPQAADEVASLFEKHGAGRVSAAEVKAVLRDQGKEGLASIDRYSKLLGSAEKKIEMSQPSGQSVGMGVYIVDRGGALEIGQVVAGAPAAEAGVEEGDRLLGVNGVSVIGLNMAQMYGVMARTANGDNTVKLDLLRGHGPDAKTMQFTIKKRLFKFPMATSAVLPGGVGYLRLMGFPLDITADLRKELEKLSARGVNRLVLDLRYNTGGMLSEVSDCLKLFTGGRKTLVSAASDKAQYNATYKADAAPAPFEGMRLIVLVNAQTLSGAEIMAASLRDNNGALVIGTRTGGQTAIQNMFLLHDGTGRALKLAVAYMLPPSGVSLEGKGLVPDMALVPSEQEETAVRVAWVQEPGRIIPADRYVAEALKAASRLR